LRFYATVSKTLLLRNKNYEYDLMNLPPNVKLIIPKELKIKTNVEKHFLDKNWY